jgi:pSer/pThr/pTyr-binding forkhead associated (FHA) protein
MRRLLVDRWPVAHRAIAESDLPTTRADPWESGEKAGTSEAQRETMLIIIPPSGRQLTLPAEGEAVIGRLDATRGVFPNIDLTPEGGLEGGVSRRHARIHKQKTQYFIEDLGSANGTFLNGQRLTPYLPHPLHDNDELQLGRVRIQVSVR